jgi:hypothetical protein
MTGGVTSVTVTLNVQVLVLPAASVALACTVVVPTGKLDPDAWSSSTGAAEQLSFAVTAKVTLAAHVPGTALTLMSPGQVITGGVLSMTVIVWTALWLFVASSVALKVRLMIKGSPGLPAPLLVSVTLIAGSSQLSVAVACEGSASGTSLAH